MSVVTPTWDCWTREVMKASMEGRGGSNGDPGALVGGVDGGVGGMY